MDSVTKTLRSALISTKGKCDVHTLRKDYRMLMGEDVPFKKFGYSRIEDFLKDCKTLSVTEGPNGQMLVDALPTAKSEHIQSLVNRQKTTHKKKSKILLKQKSFSRTKTTSNWKPASTNKKWQPSSEASSHMTTISHIQFVSPKKSSSHRPSTNQRPPLLPTPVSSVRPTHSKKNVAKPSTLQSPRSRAAATSGNVSDDNSSSGSLTSPSPPPTVEVTINRNTNTRTVKQILNNKSQTLDNCPRPRLRTQTSLPQLPIFSSPTSPPTMHFPTPLVLSKKEEDQLIRDGISAWASSMSASNSSNSGESTSWRLETTDQPEKDQNRGAVHGSNAAYKELVQFAKQYNLEVSVKNSVRVDKSSRSVFHCCAVKVNGHHYSSYPRDFIRLDDALTAVCVDALADLKTSHCKNERLFMASQQDILDRIPPMIEMHYHGVWADQIELDYQDCYKEQLPANWLAQLDTLPTVSVNVSLGLDCSQKRYVLRSCKPGERVTNSSPLPSDVSVPLKEIYIPDEGCLMQVTSATSTIDLWVCSPSELHERLYNEMQKFYNDRCDVASNINKGGFYAAYVDDGWYRVRVISIADASVKCFFIDYGDTYVVSKKNIRLLEREFAKLPVQAIACYLGGLQELVNESTGSPHLEKLIGKIFIAKKLDITDEVLDQHNIIPIVLYDTQTDENINQTLIKLITLDLAAVTIDSETINKVYLTHVEKTGDIFVQPYYEGFEKFEQLMESLQGMDFSEVPNAAAAPEKLEESDQLYVTRWKTDECYYRCKITDISPDKKYAQVMFVDFGNSEIIQLSHSSLYSLDKLSDVLFMYPYQAIRVKINIKPELLPKNFPEIMKDVWFNEIVLMKVSHKTNGEIYCDFFKRSVDNILISACTSIKLEKEIPNKIEEDTNNNNDKSTSLLMRVEQLKLMAEIEVLTKPVPSTGLLEHPELPKLNEYFEVVVPCAVNPWNFFVQPFKTSNERNRMMKKLQEKCKITPSNPITINDVIPGKIYASKHEDGFWYRTSVIKVIHTGSISVFYCDYGFYGNLSLYQLVPLEQEFLHLPYQAIKAKLAGIKPKNDKWSMDDCNYFKELVCKKAFMGVLKSVQNDELYKYDMVLGLELVDVSNPNVDVNISDKLVEANIATLK